MKIDAATLKRVRRYAYLLVRDSDPRYQPEALEFLRKLEHDEIVDLELYLCCEYLILNKATYDCLGIKHRDNGKIIFGDKESGKRLALLIDCLNHEVRVEDSVFPFNLKYKTVCDSVDEAWCAACRADNDITADYRRSTMQLTKEPNDGICGLIVTCVPIVCGMCLFWGTLMGYKVVLGL